MSGISIGFTGGLQRQQLMGGEFATIPAAFTNQRWEEEKTCTTRTDLDVSDPAVLPDFIRLSFIDRVIRAGEGGDRGRVK